MYLSTAVFGAIWFTLRRLWHARRLINRAKRLNSTLLRGRVSAKISVHHGKLEQPASWFSRLSVFMSDPLVAGSCKHYIWTMRTILLKCNNGALWNIVRDEYSRTDWLELVLTNVFPSKASTISFIISTILLAPTRTRTDRRIDESSIRFRG